VNLDPNRLRAYGIPVSRVVEAVRSGNKESGGRLLEFGGTEYMVRGRGYAHSIEDFENIPLSAAEDGSQIRIKDVGQVAMGPDLRRGVADLDGTGDVVSGIVVMRDGANALDVINRVKAKIKEIEPGFPPGVKLIPIYDRSELIHKTISTVKQTIIEVMITVVLIILVFLWHFPSAAIPIVTMPVAVLLAPTIPSTPTWSNSSKRRPMRSKACHSTRSCRVVTNSRPSSRNSSGAKPTNRRHVMSVTRMLR
jgi:Cu(I)/Ag(I) efflux system membrane protein CusA/SilA